MTTYDGSGSLLPTTPPSDNDEIPVFDKRPEVGGACDDVNGGSDMGSGGGGKRELVGVAGLTISLEGCC